MQGIRICWGPMRTSRFTVTWRIIHRQSYVVVTASEGEEGLEDGVVLLDSESPHRFIGAAAMTVQNIAPRDGGVSFRVRIDWPQPLTLWTDILVFDDIRDLGTHTARRR